MDSIGNAMGTLFGESGSERQSGWAHPFISMLLKTVLPGRRINELISKLDSQPKWMSISDRVLEVLESSFEISKSDQARVPDSGPLVAVANHPFGAVEGMILASILARAGRETKIMTNFLLGSLGISELNEILLFVNPFEMVGSKRQNVKPLREAIDWVRGGRALGVFPAGEVSHVSLRKMAVMDSHWSPTVARIIRKAEAAVLPVYFEGRNSFLFCALGLLHPLLRTMMLPRENLNRGSRKFRVYVGKPVPFKKLSQLDDSAMMDYLRLRTYNLRNRSGEKRRGILPKPVFATVPKRQPVARPRSAGSIAGELRNLPSEQLLVSSKNFDVFSAIADQAPNTLHEMGRQREIAFREAGEGTGRPLDIDRFDYYYQHIILWDRQRREIVGGYRLGPVETILKAHGTKGLYTCTLFDYQNELFAKIHPCLEVGRSFVRPEYQKTYQPLLLLWSGIGNFVMKNPQFRFLFGAVSISNDYLGISRRLMVKYLEDGYTRPDLAKLVRPRHPVARWHGVKKNPGPAYCMVSDINDFSEIISDIEKDSKGVPILLKHYMKLGGQFLGFGKDPAFGKSIDALVLVDLVRTDRKIMERYMGQQGAESFLQFHSVQTATHDDKCA